MEVVRMFDFTAQQLADDISANFRQRDISDPESTPEDIASGFVSETLKTPEAVLGAARLVLAHDVAMHPEVRRLVRDVYFKYCEVSTTPTTRGKREIDAFHIYAVCGRMMIKPCDTSGYQVSCQQASTGVWQEHRHV